MKKLNDDQIVAILRDDLSSALVFSDESQASRSAAMDYYHATGIAVEANPGDICDGRSRVVSTDVADMVDACIAMMMPSLSDGVCEFEPQSNDEEEQCQVETDITNYYMWDKNRGYDIFRGALFDALLQKNCCVRVWWEDNVTTDVREYENLTWEEAQMLVLKAQQNEEQSIDDFDETDKKNDSYSLAIRTTKQRSCPRFAAFPPEQLRLNADHEDVSVKEARFVAYRPSSVTESDLISQGFDRKLVEDLPNYEWNDDMAASSRDSESEYTYETSGPNRVVDYTECFAMLDVDGDGISERRRIVISGNVILENDEVSCVPIITGSCLPVPHQFWGLSLFDKLKNIQDTKTQLLRGTLDNLNLSINNRLKVNPDQIHNPDELMTSRPGGIIQVKRSDAVEPLATPPMDGSVMQAMEYMDKMRTERSGAALDMTTDNLPIGPNTTNHTAERIMSSVEMIQMQMTTAFTEYVLREVFWHTHRLLREHSDGEIALRANRQYLVSDPRQWPDRDNINTVVGASAGERSRKAQAVATVLMQQNTMMQLGGGSILLNPKGIYNAAVDLARYSGLDFPDQYYLDPDSPEAQQAVQQQAQQAAQQQQMAEQKEQQMMQFQAQMVQMAEATKREKTQSDATIKMQQLQLEYIKLQSEADNMEADNMREEQKLELQARIEMAKEETKRQQQESDDAQFWENLEFQYDELLKDTEVEYAKMETVQ